MIMQAYLIDPKARIVESCDYSGDWKDISGLIECDSFDVAGTDKLSVYVDDEGLFKPERHFFMIGTYPQPLCNKALLLGPVDYDTGETLEASWTLEEAQALVKFLSYEEALTIAKEMREWTR